jgi:lysophospholipase L1-like esterase
MNVVRTLVTLLLLAALAATPALAARGSADFTRYVALGDSFGAGVSNGSLVITHQLWSYPAVIARQAGVPVCGPDPGCIGFHQPLVSEPGLGPELALQSLFPSVVIAPKAAAGGQPLLLQLPRPYNNLSVPGFRVGHMTTVTGAEPESGSAQFILRGLGTAVQQAIALHPTFITVWIGGNDVLGAVLAGTPAALTPAQQFRDAYAAMLDQLTAGAPGAGIVVGTIPDPTLVAFVHAVPPFTTLPNGQRFYFIADLGGGQIGQLPEGSLLTLNAMALLGQGFGASPAKPLPDTVALTPTEIAAIRLRGEQINDQIRELAGARDIPVVELDEAFTEDVTAGISYGGVELDASFLTGGLFSLDGFHLTDIGYTIFANQWIATINEEYATDIPLASIVPFFQNNAPLEEYGMIPPRSAFSFAPGALDSVWEMLKLPEPAAPAPVRRRGVGRF